MTQEIKTGAISESDYRTMEIRAKRQGYSVERPQLRQDGRPGLRAAFAGIGVSPQLAGLLRGILYVVLLTAGEAALIYLQTPPLWLAAYAGLLSGAIRLIEGLLDAYFKGNASATAPEGK